MSGKRGQPRGPKQDRLKSASEEPLGEYKPRILVVDDDQQVLRLMEEMLREMGADPTCVGSSLLAVEVVEREMFDGIFLDWKMPDLDGMGLAARVRASKQNAQCPIILFTGVSSESAIKDSFRAGIDFYIQKPIRMAQIREILEHCHSMVLVERRRQQRVAVEIPVWCEWGDRSSKGTSLDLSVNGILVELEKIPPLGVKVQIRFSLPGDASESEMVARVARIVAGNKSAGLEFINVSRETLSRLVRFTEKAAPRP